MVTVMQFRIIIDVPPLGLVFGLELTITTDGHSSCACGSLLFVFRVLYYCLSLASNALSVACIDICARHSEVGKFVAAAISVCTHPWDPFVSCEAGGNSSNFSGYDVGAFSTAL
eukprot:scaffold1343_cov45-Prasinocladus_malaysianus.AAC.2